MYFADLARECQIAAGNSIRAVGWLSSEHPFSTGAVPPAFASTLDVLIRNGWVPVAMAGLHACEFCRGTPYHESANVLIPGDNVL